MARRASDEGQTLDCADGRKSADISSDISSNISLASTHASWCEVDDVVQRPPACKASAARSPAPPLSGAGEKESWRIRATYQGFRGEPRRITHFRTAQRICSQFGGSIEFGETPQNFGRNETDPRIHSCALSPKHGCQHGSERITITRR